MHFKIHTLSSIKFFEAPVFLEMGVKGHFFLQAISLLNILMTYLAMALSNITTDQYALLAFKSELSLDPSHVLSRNWSVSFPTCKWIGVTCSSRHQRVSALDVSGMGLTGNLPSQLGNLSFLVSLNLSGNVFLGKLPDELAQLRRVRFLDFGFNSFAGDIPSWFGVLVELRFLRLRNNSFTGSLPSSITNMPKLEVLDISYNPLQGNIPESIGSLFNLRELRLQYNNLSGIIPVSVFNISTIESIAFKGNKLFGNLPEGMCHRTSNLKRLSLSSNELEGPIPPNISECSQLSLLSLAFNKFSGSIPREIGNLRSLEILYLGSNHFTGTIPEEVSNLYNLEKLNLGFNHLTGYIPEKIFNISTVNVIGVTGNQLWGYLPSILSYGLPNLQELYLNENFFFGEITESISNFSKLTIIYFSSNNLSGQVPNSFGKLNLLETLALSGNNFVSETSELSFIGPMKNCSYLTNLGFGDNPFNGILPVSVGNLSTTIRYFYAYNCGLRGSIPDAFGNLENLIMLSLHGNALTGTIPNTLVNLKELQGLGLFRNKISGPIPDSLCMLPHLYRMRLDQNQITGSIPDCMGNLTSLRKLYLGNNRLNSVIPRSLWKLNDLLELNLSANLLTGVLPSDIENLKVAVNLDLSNNQLSSIIPSSIGGLQSVIFLSLARNRFQGSIPQSVGNLVSLETLDLSHNNLSGTIPMSLEKLQYLKYFDVSFNQLSGPIPTGGPFQSFSSQFFVSNVGLCGDSKYGVPPCHENTITESKRKKVILRIVYIFLGISVLVFAITLSYILARYRKKNKTETPTNISFDTAPSRVLYEELVKATEGFNENHLLGKGSYGSVYKGTLQNGEDVAIKVFNLQSEGGFKSFDTECEVMRRLRHRNLCKVIGSCSNEDFKALVLQYMPNGSLGQWLYSENNFLDIVQRLNIMIDVACALEYLHHGYSIPIVHCDLKPSNVLLDDDMVAHLSDFGVAKLLSDGVSVTLTRTLATLGYIAPEYGSEGLVTVKCDVYSYGIILMEVFTRTKPNYSKFTGDLSLRSWVNDSVPNALVRVIDLELLRGDEQHSSEKLECLVSIMEIALQCSMENPSERIINMKYVVVALKKIMSKLLQYFLQVDRVN
ncbi:uncharacterized protein [Primulina eburnea]|uniref:uncharacterized protein isoform X2 n=1 Tax=Primulina eburnea TaxID=1245227 RepID=UPI003C6C8545